MMTAWTSGCRRRIWGREVVENDEEACGMVGWLGGGRSTVVNGEALGRRRLRGELARSAPMTGGSSSNPVLEEEAMTVSLSPGLDGNERLR
jgi:hypothetical protein